MANQRIRDAARIKDVKLWQVAERFNVTDAYFSKMLRKEFSEEEAAKALRYIDQIAEERTRNEE